MILVCPDARWESGQTSLPCRIPHWCYHNLSLSLLLKLILIIQYHYLLLLLLLFPLLQLWLLIYYYRYKYMLRLCILSQKLFSHSSRPCDFAWVQGTQKRKALSIFSPSTISTTEVETQETFFKKHIKYINILTYKILKHQPRISNQESGQRHRGPEGIGIVCGTDRTGGSAPASFDMHHGAHAICPSSPAWDFQPGPEQWTSSGIRDIGMLTTSKTSVLLKRFPTCSLQIHKITQPLND